MSKGDTQRILEMAKEKIEGQAMSKEKLERVGRTLAEHGAANATDEARAFAEEIVSWLQEQWAIRQFSKGQAIYSVSLACANLRHFFPTEAGGTAVFDKEWNEAWNYFVQATNSA